MIPKVVKECTKDNFVKSDQNKQCRKFHGLNNKIFRVILLICQDEYHDYEVSVVADTPPQEGEELVDERIPG